MLKVYEMDVMRSSIEIKVGETYERIRFDGGIIAGVHRIAAVFSTAEDAVQKAVEALPMFGKGEIRLRAGQFTEEKNVVPPPREDEEHTFPQVTNTQQAKEILQTHFQVEISTEAATGEVVAKAKEAGLFFPSWAVYNK